MQVSVVKASGMWDPVWDLFGPGIEPMSPALAGRFLTTGPPGKSKHWLIFVPSRITGREYVDMLEENVPDFSFLGNPCFHRNPILYQYFFSFYSHHSQSLHYQPPEMSYLGGLAF